MAASFRGCSDGLGGDATVDFDQGIEALLINCSAQCAYLIQPVVKNAVAFRWAFLLALWTSVVWSALT